MAYTVYKHTSPSGKVYIGITSSPVNRRWQNGKGYRQHRYFNAAIQKYGWQNFTHEILFSNLSKYDACEKEKELIMLYNSTDRRFGYNQSTGGESGACGVHPSQETMICIETGEMFFSVADASRSIGKSYTSVWNVVSGKRITAGGFHWKYLEDTKNEN